MPNLIKKFDPITGQQLLGLIKNDELDSTVLEFLTGAFASLMLATNSIQPSYDPLSFELTWDVIRKALGGLQETTDGLIVGTDASKGTAIDASNNVVVDISGVTEATSVTNANQVLVNVGGVLKRVSLWNLLKGNREWYTVTEAALAGKAETFEWALKRTELQADAYGYNLNITVGSSFSCHGKISHIGGSGSNPDWTDFKNRFVLLSAGGNGWFGLSNAGANDTAPAYTKPIRNNMGIELHGLRKALLYYDEDGDAGLGCWIVLSFERATLSKRYEVPSTTFAAGNPSVVVPTAGIDMEGWYWVTVRVDVEEREFVGGVWQSAITAIAQTLTITDTNGTETYVLQTSPVGGGGGITPAYFFNTSLQGTCKIKVTGDLKPNRKWTLTAGLPNGEEVRITGGYLHAHYIGYLETD